MEAALADAKLGVADVDWLLLHQANQARCAPCAPGALAAAWMRSAPCLRTEVPRLGCSVARSNNAMHQRFCISVHLRAAHLHIRAAGAAEARESGVKSVS